MLTSFPNKFRAAGRSPGSLSRWICGAVLTMCFPSMMVTLVPGDGFLVSLWNDITAPDRVRLMISETKGVSLDAIERRLAISP
jgi:nitrate reductase NapE component